MRFSKLAGEPWPGPGAAWWRGFEAATEPYLPTATPKELRRLLKILSIQQQHLPLGRRWLTAFLQASMAYLLQMAGPETAAATAADRASQQQPLSARDLAQTAMGLTGMGVLPDTSWLQAWQNAVVVAEEGWSREVGASVRLRQREFNELARLQGLAGFFDIVKFKESRAARRQRYRQRYRQSGRSRQGGGLKQGRRPSHRQH